MSAPSPKHEPLNAAASLRVLIALHGKLAPLLDADLAIQVAQAIRYLNTTNQETDTDERWRGPDGLESRSVYTRVSQEFAVASIRSGECFLAQDIYGNFCHYWGREDMPVGSRILSNDEALGVIEGQEGT